MADDEECLEATHHYHEDNKFVNVGVHRRDNKVCRRREYDNVQNKNYSSNLSVCLAILQPKGVGIHQAMRMLNVSA